MAELHIFPASAIRRIVRPTDPDLKPRTLAMAEERYRAATQQVLSQMRIQVREAAMRSVTFAGLAVFALGFGGAMIAAHPVESAIPLMVGAASLVVAALLARISRLAQLDYRQRLGEYRRVPLYRTDELRRKAS